MSLFGSWLVTCYNTVHSLVFKCLSNPCVFTCVCSCVWGGVHGHSCIHMCVKIHVCVCRGQRIAFVLQELSTTFLRPDLSLAWSLSGKLGWQVSESQWPFCPHLPSAGIISMFCRGQLSFAKVLGIKLRYILADWSIPSTLINPVSRKFSSLKCCSSLIFCSFWLFPF